MRPNTTKLQLVGKEKQDILDSRILFSFYSRACRRRGSAPFNLCQPRANEDFIALENNNDEAAKEQLRVDMTMGVDDDWLFRRALGLLGRGK